MLVILLGLLDMSTSKRIDGQTRKVRPIIIQLQKHCNNITIQLNCIKSKYNRNPYKN